MVAFNLRLIVSLLACVPCSTSQLTSTGLTVLFNDIHYYISPFTTGKITANSAALADASIPNVYGFWPITVVQDSVSATSLPSLFANWTWMDDVFQSGFLGAVFQSGSATTGDGIHRRNIDSAAGTSLVLPLNSSTIPSGPYFLEAATGSVYPVYRLYPDFAGAFTESLIQRPDGTFQTLSAQVPASASLTIGVPSRLYFRKTEDKPLAGVRIGVKDIFQLAGTKTSNGNRAWYNLYPASNVTGTAIQRLIDAGAQIVGLQKPSQFANGEAATDWVDYHSPFNPRGDGYQDPSASSAGAGASIASYDWLDIAVGSDTGGSIRAPSGVQGLFGNRPSHGLVNLDHVMPLSTALDTAGFLVRDPFLWDVAQSVLYDDNYTSLASTKPSYPKTIYTVSFPSNRSTSPQAVILNNFVRALAGFVGGKPTPINLASQWTKTRPVEAGKVSLSQLLNTTYATFISKEQTDLVRDPFYADYAAAHDGRLPFVDPAPLARWAFGDSLPDSALDQAIRNKTLFMDWFGSEVLAPVDNPAQCSSALMLYASSGGDQAPRNLRPPKPPKPPFGFSVGRISVMAECPDFVFPLGQVSSFSPITKHAEFLPVTVDILAAKGCDGLLVKLAQDLTVAGILSPPRVGGTITGGDVLMRKRAERMGITDFRYMG